MNVLIIILSLIIALSFIGFLIYTAKGGNLLIGLFSMAALWTLIALIYEGFDPYREQNMRNTSMEYIMKVFHEGPVGYGETTAIIIFASWFGRVLVDTGIAGDLIKRVVEIAGDRELTVVLVVSLVTSAIFMSIFGPGSVIAMGTIILPIFFSIGVKKELAVGAFLMSVASGMYINGGYVSQFSGHIFFEKLFKEDIGSFNSKFTKFTLIATVVHIIIMLIYIVYMYRKTNDNIRTWKDDTVYQKTKSSIKPIAFLTPFIPVIMTLGVNIFKYWYPNIQSFSVIFSFIVGIFFGLLSTGNLKTYKKALESIQKTLQNAIQDVALLIGMLLAMNTFAKAAGLIAPIISISIGSSLDWIVNKPFVAVLIFMILAPLALFRGPFMIWGSGIALVSVINAVLTNGNPDLTGTFPLLLALFYNQPVGITASTGPTQSWNMWALSYSDYKPKEFLKNNFIWGWLITAINIFLAYKILI